MQFETVRVCELFATQFVLLPLPLAFVSIRPECNLDARRVHGYPPRDRAGTDRASVEGFGRLDDDIEKILRRYRIALLDVINYFH